ncbi:MAG: LamG domain-containing protein [Verrucomicrobia bacterium]|nr:LamG domain-containing protein [Verrucomicrobiota bacterium]
MSNTIKIAVMIMLVFIFSVAGATRAEDEAKRQALQFDGKADYVVAPLTAPLTEDLTLEAWICASVKAGLQERIAALSGPQGSLQLCINNGRLVLDNEGGPSQSISGPAGLNDGRWHHLLVKRYQKTTYALYCDGVDAGSAEGTTPPYTELYIGVAPGKPFFQGAVDEVRLYNRCITEAEGSRNYRGEKAAVTDALGITRQGEANIVSDGLVGWWKLDGDTNDSAGKQNGKINGKPVWGPGRGDALYDKPRISSRFYPGPGKVSVDVDTRMMGAFPPGASWEIVLRRSEGVPVARRVVTPIPPALMGEVSLAVAKPVPGEVDVRARLLGPEGRPLLKEAADKAALSERPAWVGKVKILNNLVWELLNASPRAGGADAKFSFTNPRAGWVFFAATSAGDFKEGDRAELILDSHAVNQSLIVHEGGRASTHEAMRYLPAGDHTLTVARKGKAALSRIVVRRIPEIMFDEYLQNHNVIKDYPPRDAEFMEKNGLFNVLTTLQVHGGRSAAPPHGQEWRAAGRHLTEGGPLGADATAEDLCERWLAPLGKSWVDGVSVDEFMHYTPRLTEAIKRAIIDPRLRGKRFYAFCCAPVPERGGAEGTIFLRTLMEAGHYALWERYLQEPPTESEGWHSMHVGVRDAARAYWLPICADAMAHTVLAFGNFMSSPPTNFNVQPGVDFKVWMDMQYNLIANDPMFFGLAGLMEWTSGYADDENIRWAAKLYRHYAIEGRTDMLSPKHGFKFALTHLQNGDFAEGLKHWDAQPADGGGLEVGRLTGFSSLQGRYPETSQGNTFLRMKRSAKAPNTVSQTIKELVPGKLYSVKFLAANYGDLLAGKSERKMLVVGLTVANANLLPEKSLQNPFASGTFGNGNAGAFNSKNAFWNNYLCRVFRAKGNEARLTISDWLDDKEPGAPVGQEIICNFIEVQPYLEEGDA